MWGRPPSAVQRSEASPTSVSRHRQCSNSYRGRAALQGPRQRIRRKNSTLPKAAAVEQSSKATVPSSVAQRFPDFHTRVVTSDLAFHSHTAPSSSRARRYAHQTSVPKRETNCDPTALIALNPIFCPQVIEPHRLLCDFPLT